MVRSERSVVSDPAFATHVRGIVAQARRSGSVKQISSYLDPGGKILISADRHATVLPVVVAAPEEDRIADLISLVERSDGSGGFAAHITGTNTLDRDFTELSASDLSKGELQFGLPAALIVLLLVVGTLVGVAIPMLMAIISIIVALGITAVVGQAFELNLFILNMIVAMGLALGIDYSLFIVSRLREERHRGAGTREAILTVANTATRAVVFSGTAFALAMIAMLLVPDTTLAQPRPGRRHRRAGLDRRRAHLPSRDPDGPRRSRRALAGAVARAARRGLGRRGGPALAARRARGHAPSGDQPDRHHSRPVGARLPGPRAAVGRRRHVVAAEQQRGQAGAARAGARLPQRRDRAGHRRL